MNKLEQARQSDDESLSALLMEEVTTIRRSPPMALARMTRITPKSERALSKFLPQVEVTISSLER